jgi:hypothetical protein
VVAEDAVVVLAGGVHFLEDLGDVPGPQSQWLAEMSMLG